MSAIDDILRNFNRNPGATEEALRRAVEALNAELPSDYVTFLREGDGGEGIIGENYVILWKAEELAEMTKAYNIAEYAPDLLLIGSDGGGEAFAFDVRTVPWSVVQVPFVGMDLQYADVLASTFDGFLKALAG